MDITDKIGLNINHNKNNNDDNNNNKVRNEAEKKLAEVHKIIGFGPVLLQVRNFRLLPV